MNILDLAKEAGLEPKKKAATHGAEFCSPCPLDCKCGNDRFLLWPDRANKNGEYRGGRFSCRVCGKFGDAITFLKELYGIPYKEACARLRIEPKTRGVSLPKKEIKLPVVIDPPELWQQKANIFVQWGHKQLMENPETLALIQNRGFTFDSIKRFKLGYNPLDLWREREGWGLKPEKKMTDRLKNYGCLRELLSQLFQKIRLSKLKFVEIGGRGTRCQNILS